MKVLWITPTGDGLDIARRVRGAGHQLVTAGVRSELPSVARSQLYAFARAADLVVVDGSFPLERTRRSWKPCRDALFVDEVRRKHGVVALGPTPTIDLLVGDRRYCRKWCERLGVPYNALATGEPWSAGAWFRENDIVPPGPYLESWKPLFKSVGFRGWFELVGVLTPHGPVVHRISTRWPKEAIPEGREAEFLRSMQ